MLKKLSLALFCSCLLSFAANAQTMSDDGDSSTYKDCIDKSGGGDQKLTTCTLTEAARILKLVEKKYESMANDTYFQDWNKGAGFYNGNMKKLYGQWVDYRDQYCSLYGFSFTKGEGSLGELSGSECVLELTKRQNKDLNVIMQNIQE